MINDDASGNELHVWLNILPPCKSACQKKGGPEFFKISPQHDARSAKQQNIYTTEVSLLIFKILIILANFSL